MAGSDVCAGGGALDVCVLLQALRDMARAVAAASMTDWITRRVMTSLPCGEPPGNQRAPWLRSTRLSHTSVARASYGTSASRKACFGHRGRLDGSRRASQRAYVSGRTLGSGRALRTLLMIPVIASIPFLRPAGIIPGHRGIYRHMVPYCLVVADAWTYRLLGCLGRRRHCLHRSGSGTRSHRRLRPRAGGAGRWPRSRRGGRTCDQRHRRVFGR